MLPNEDKIRTFLIALTGKSDQWVIKKKRKEKKRLVALNLFGNRLTNVAFTINLFLPPFLKVVQFFVSIKV